MENLQELDIIFTDKTGTLTKNQMLFHSLSDQNNVVTELYSEVKRCHQDQFQRAGTYRQQFDLGMLFQLALCNTVLKQRQEVTRNGKQIQIDEYQGESPDEIAFANAAKTYGLTLG